MENTDLSFNESLLDDLINSIEEQEIEELKIPNKIQESYKIKSSSEANYFIRKYKELLKNNEEIKEAADEYTRNTLHKVNVWKEKQLNANNRSIEFFLNLLENYAKEQNVLETKTQKLKLVDGTIGFYKQQNSYEYNDEKVVKFLMEEEANELLTPVLPKYNKTNLKKHSVEKDGKLYFNDKVIPGVVITQKPNKFGIR